MIEQTGGGQQQSAIERVDFEQWERQMLSTTGEKLTRTVTYIGALLTANITMAKHEVLDRIMQRPAIKRAAAGLINSLASVSIGYNPDAAARHYDLMPHDIEDAA